jgi:hypothetical protein
VRRHRHPYDESTAEWLVIAFVVIVVLPIVLTGLSFI